MWTYLMARLAQAAAVLFVVSVVAFGLSHLSGDPVRLMAAPGASESDLARLRAALGLDRSLPEQYWSFISGVVRGDLGESVSFRRPVAELIAARIPATVELAVAAMALAVSVGLSSGIVAAMRGGWFDRIAGTVALLGQSIPVFWLGLVLILIFALGLRMLPSSGRGGLDHLLLPAVTLATYPMAQIMRLMRSELRETLKADYIRTARSKGLTWSEIVIRHALRNALLPVVTVIGLQLGAILGGAILAETIFAWPGLGRLAVQAVLARDYPLVEGIVIVIATVFIVINALVDMSYAVIDPRIRVQG